jgi:hypothetical protein
MTNPLLDPARPLLFSQLSAGAAFQLCADLEVPSGRGFIAMLEAFRATGGTASGEVASRLLESHQVANTDSLVDLIFTNQVFGFEWRSKLWIPMFQFDLEDLSLKLGAQQVRAALPSLWYDWVLASWFAMPNTYLDGYRPVDLLESDFDAVLGVARSVHAAEGFSLANAPQTSQQYPLNF